MFEADATFNFTENTSVHETVVKQGMQEGAPELSASKHLQKSVQSGLQSHYCQKIIQNVLG